MASIDFLLGVAFENQTARGTATAMPAIGAGAGTGGAINEADGAVLGSPSGGVGESGIGFQIGKNVSEKAVITGSFSKGFANFLNRTVESFQIVTEIKGSGITGSNPLVASNFLPPLGIIALWRAAGFQPVATAAAYTLSPDPTQLVTAAIFFGNESSNGGQIILRDVEVSSLSMQFTPGEVALATWDLVAEFDSFNETGSWPAVPFEYGNQATLSAPVVRGVNFIWGPDTPAAREIGFSELTIAVDNEFETVASSNSSTGTIQRQTGRTITITGTIDATDGEFLYELNQVGEGSIAAAESLTFQIGTAAVIGQPVNSFSVSVADPELVSLEPDRLGASQAWKIELVARAVLGDGEATFLYV